MMMKMMRMSKAAETAEMMAEDLMSSKMSQCRECGTMANQVEPQGTEEGEVEVHELSRKKLARELTKFHRPQRHSCPSLPRR